MFDAITCIEDLNRRRTELLADPDLRDERIAEINREFSARRRQISLLQRGKNAVLMPYRIITHRAADPDITADAVFNPDAMLLTVFRPAQTPFRRDTGKISVHNQIDITIAEQGNPVVVYSSFS
jgi:hypothetical protein